MNTPNPINSNPNSDPNHSIPRIRRSIYQSNRFKEVVGTIYTLSRSKHFVVFLNWNQHCWDRWHAVTVVPAIEICGELVFIREMSLPIILIPSDRPIMAVPRGGGGGGGTHVYWQYRYVRPLRPPFHALPAVPKHIFFIARRSKAYLFHWPTRSYGTQLKSQFSRPPFHVKSQFPRPPFGEGPLVLKPLGS